MFTALREHAEFFVLFQRETLTVSVVSNQPGVCRAVGSFFMVVGGGGGGGGVKMSPGLANDDKF